MEITQRAANGVQIFTLQGRIDSAGAAKMDQMLQQAASNRQYKMILDMSQVTYVNSAGLRSLADILTRNRAQEGDLRLVALHPKVERVFKIIGFDKFFNMYASVEAAMQGF